MHDQRRPGLHHLGRHPGHAGGITVGLQAVLVGARARAAGLKVAEGEEPVGARPGAAPDGQPERVRAARHQAPRHGLHERGVDRRRDHVPHQVAGGHRRRLAAVEDGAFGGGHVHGPEGAVVVRHLGIHRRLHGE